MGEKEQRRVRNVIFNISRIFCEMASELYISKIEQEIDEAHFPDNSLDETLFVVNLSVVKKVSIQTF